MTTRIAEALSEIEAAHTALYPDCADQGPTTCPEWEAIYALRAALSTGAAVDWDGYGGIETIRRQLRDGLRGRKELAHMLAPAPDRPYGASG